MGELYIADHLGGEIFKLVPDTMTDCNQNHTPDYCDISAGTSADQNENGVPDECEGQPSPHAIADVGAYALYQNSPNPFSANTVITFDIVRDGHVLLDVLDVRGRNVTTVVDDTLSAGRHSVTLETSSLPAGVYLYRLRVNNFTAQNKMLLMK